jgi:tetratricopeptide (TPR) repeat protein
VKSSELPDQVDKLAAYAEEELKKQTPESAMNALVAVDKGLAIDPRSYDLNFRGAQAAAWLTEEFTEKHRRADVAKKGIDYATHAVEVDGGRVEGHYYLGINIGQEATTKTVGGYPLVPKVIKQAEAAVKIDERYDHAGPLRLLGSVYAKAPPWPASVGDVDEGLKYLSRAVQLAGDDPQNHLLYADALLSDGQLDKAENEYKKVLEVQPGTEWGHRLPTWRKEAQDGIDRIARKRGAQGRNNSGGGSFP